MKDPQGKVLSSGFRKRGLANGVSPFSSENEKEENGRKRKETEEIGTRKKQPKKGKNGNGRKRKKTEKIGSDTVPATPFAKSRCQGTP